MNEDYKKAILGCVTVLMLLLNDEAKKDEELKKSATDTPSNLQGEKL